MGTGELTGKWQPDEMLKGNLAEDWLLIRGWGGGGKRSNAIQVASCYGNWNKLQLHCR